MEAWTLKEFGVDRMLYRRCVLINLIVLELAEKHLIL
jgi:hypothetical protein